MRKKTNKPSASTTRPELRRFEVLLFLPWALGTLLLSIHFIGAKLFLVYLYGWDRVQAEHLQILRMPKGGAWPVSNGDMIKDDQFIHFLISFACWFVMFFATYPWVRLLLPRESKAVEPEGPKRTEG